jgi:hypothetical protein
VRGMDPCSVGAPEEIRTPDPQIRSLMQFVDFICTCPKLRRILDMRVLVGAPLSDGRGGFS